MLKYLISSKKKGWEGYIELSFYESTGGLAECKFPEYINEQALTFFENCFPVHDSFIEPFQNAFPSVEVQQVVESDWTFEQFWKTYNQFKDSVGSKPLAEEYWAGKKKILGDRTIGSAERREIQRVLPDYVKKYSNNKTFQPLASSFLHKGVWIGLLERKVETPISISTVMRDKFLQVTQRTAALLNDSTKL